jgi:hypothetical protein
MAVVVNVNTGKQSYEPGNVNGEEIVRGVVQAELSGNKLRVWIPDAQTGAGQIIEAARRDPSDYGPEGGGLTWFPVRK